MYFILIIIYTFLFIFKKPINLKNNNKTKYILIKNLKY